jgi:hypothetical protein
VGRVGVAVLVIASSAGIAFGGGCGGAGNDPVPVNEFTALHFTTEGLAGNPPPPDVDVTVTDASTVRTIYEATMDLPAFPPGRTNCPSDPGVRYIADFLDGQKVLVEAVLNPAGCSDVTITGSATRQSLSSAYWQTLADSLGIQESTIYPLAFP